MTSERVLPTSRDIIGCVEGEATPRAAPVNEAHAQRLAEVFKAEHKKVVQYLLPKTRSEAEAKDVAAQAFSEIFTMKDAGSVEKMDFYVYKAAAFIAIDRRRHAEFCKRTVETFQNDFPAEAPPPEPMIADREREALLLRAIAGLDPVWRAAVIQRYFEQKSFEEIAQHFKMKGIRVDSRTIRRWVEKALLQCRQFIREGEGEGAHS